MNHVTQASPPAPQEAAPRPFDPFDPESYSQPTSMIEVVNPIPLSTYKPLPVGNQHPSRVFPVPRRKINDQELIDRFNAGATGRELAAYFGCSPAAISKRLKRVAPSAPKAIDQLTPSQAGVVKRITAGESPVNAVEQCYNTTSRKSAQEIARKVLAVPGVILALNEEMDNAGLTRRYRVSKLAEHCEAADPGVSLKALGLAFTLADEMPATTNRNINVNVDICPVDLSMYQ